MRLKNRTYSLKPFIVWEQGWSALSILGMLAAAAPAKLDARLPQRSA
jgi:hypothetical protein